MKQKLFSIIFALALMWSGSASAAIYNLSFSWSDGVSSMGHMKEYTFWEYYNSSMNQYHTVQITFAQDFGTTGSVNTSKPALTLYLVFNSATNYGSLTFPSAATYEVETNVANIYYPQIVAFGQISRKQVSRGTYKGYYYNAFIDTDGTWYYGTSSLTSKVWPTTVSAGSQNITGGSLTIQSGANGYPYITGTLTTSSNTINVTIGATNASAGTITAQPNNASYGTVTGGGSYAGGTQVTLSAAANDGYAFKQWSDGVYTPERTVTVNGNATYTAQFVQINENLIFDEGYLNYANDESWLQLYSATEDGYQAKIVINSSIGFGENVFYGTDYYGTSTSHTAIKTPSGTYSVSSCNISVNYDNDYRVAIVNADMFASDGKCYHVEFNTNRLLDNMLLEMYENDNQSTVSGISFAAATPTDYSSDIKQVFFGTFASNSTNGAYIEFRVDNTLNGKVPSGRYPINATQNAQTVMVGAYPYGGDDLNGTIYSNRGNYWFLRYGYVDVTNVNETYYYDVHGNNSYDYSVTYTAGTAPKTLTFNSDANGSVSASFNATNWGKTITDYAEGTAYPFFTGQTIVLTPTPADGYEFDSWSGGSPTDNGNGTYSITIGASNVSLTANFRAATSSHTVTIAVDETNNYGTVSTTSITDVPDGATISVNGNQITINNTTVTATPTTAIAQYTYTFSSWKNGSTVLTGNSNTVTDDITIKANFTRATNTYTVTIAKNEDDWGTISTTSVANVPYGTVISNNGATVTINSTPVTATPATSDAQYSYAFSGWTNGAATVTGNMTVTANFTRTVNTYDITFKNADGTTLKKSDGTTDAIYTVAYGATPAYDGATPTKAADSEYTYTFNAWTPAIATVTTAATYTATYSTTKVQYTLAWDVNSGNELTGTYTNGTMDWGTAITKPADPTKSGYTFNGWDANNDGTADDVAATMPTSDVTYKALWTAASPNITLCEKCDNSHYNTFKATYSGSAGVGVNVTYNRQFAEGRWSTMCLPFSLDLATMIANKMYGCVYEFKYATGNANVGSGVNLYFSNAKSIEAGTCYIVNANSALAEKTSFVFSGVTIDLSKDNGADLSSPETPEASVAAYNALPGDKSEGTIELVGTLRNGILMGTATGNKYMGLKDNKIYYPNTGTGSTIWAYRGIFRSSEILDKESMQKMRIIVDGEDRGELIIDEDGDILAPSDAQSRKFIENGVLYIEREGVIYDAQGKRIK